MQTIEIIQIRNVIYHNSDNKPWAYNNIITTVQKALFSAEGSLSLEGLTIGVNFVLQNG